MEAAWAWFALFWQVTNSGKRLILLVNKQPGSQASFEGSKDAKIRGEKNHSEVFKADLPWIWHVSLKDEVVMSWLEDSYTIHYYPIFFVVPCCFTTSLPRIDLVPRGGGGSVDQAFAAWRCLTHGPMVRQEELLHQWGSKMINIPTTLW